MKTLLTLLLCVAIVTPCKAPEPPTEEFATVVAVVLTITVVAVAATAAYVIIRCSKKLNKPPIIEGSTNRVHWYTKGQMQRELNTEEFTFNEPATNAVMFYRAKL